MSTATGTRIAQAASDAYRQQRRQLLEAERTLRNQHEEVARRRRALPPGPVVEDYLLHEAQPELGRAVRLSELFGDRDQLFVYNMMFGPGWDEGCESCSMWLDGLNGVARHLQQRAAFVAVAKAHEEKLRRWAELRGWNRLSLLSSRDTTINRDLGLEGADDDEQNPGISVFTRDAGGTVRLFYAGQAGMGEDDVRPFDGDPRGMDALTPVWNVFDLLPAGRGDWYPDNRYPLAD